MGMDNRDWYRDFWRKKTGYTERADFRISAGQHGRNQHRRAWEALCVVVNQAPRGADARNKACRYLVASAGCQSAAHTACCAACGQ